MSLSTETVKVLLDCKNKSSEGIQLMREIAYNFFGDNQDFIIGVNGSYARREVTSGSDVDLFFLFFKEDKISVDLQEKFKAKLVSEKLEMPSKGGVFDSPLSIEAIVKNIGGMDDTNIAITRRMLLLLEGEWVFNKNGFINSREQLIGCYVNNELRPEQVCMYLLNDIIRYWRTICVDFEYKINHDDKAKNIRLIKLRFSRLMLYLAGILAVGETYNKTVADKKKTLIELFDKPGIERIQYIVQDQANEVLESYATFLSVLNNKAIRKQLECNDSNNKEYKDLRKSAQGFRYEVFKLLTEYYKAPHPMEKALII